MNGKSYNYWLSMTDIALAQHLGKFLKYNRIQQNKTQEQVALEANISRSTLSLLEKGESVTVATFLAVLRVLDLLYVLDIFTVDNQISPIELAKLEKKKKKRARKKVSIDINKSTW